MKYLRTGRFNKNLDGIPFEEVLAEADDLGIKEMVDDLKKPSVELLHKYVINSKCFSLIETCVFL